MPLHKETLAKLLTLNPTMLRDLTLEDVLELHPLLNAQAFPYGTARKTKPIKARPINTILNKSDQSVMEKLLLATLEGSQALKAGSFVCWGVDNDVWQQAKDKLHKKYIPTEVDEDGWTTFVPKEGADAVMNAFQVVQEDYNLGPAGGFSVINPHWGDERVVSVSLLKEIGINPEECGLAPAGDHVRLYLHFGVGGDWVLQNQSDSTDVYRIAQSFFRSTYDN